MSTGGYRKAIPGGVAARGLVHTPKAATQAEDMTRWESVARVLWMRVSALGQFFISKTTVPADAEINTSEVGLYFDNTAGSPKVVAKGKDSAGTVFTHPLSTRYGARIAKRVSTEASSATPTINTDNVDIHKITALAVNVTSFTTNLTGTPADGDELHIIIVGTAARTLTWGASFEASTVPLPTTTVSTDRLDVKFIWNAATSKWRCVAAA